MREVAVLGVGMTQFGKHADKSCVELFAQAALDAIYQSNLTPQDIQALYLANCLGDFTEGQLVMAGMAAGEIGIPHSAPATRVEAACAAGSTAIYNGFTMVASGMKDLVLVGGVERALAMDTPMATRTFAMASDGRYEFFSGITFPGVFAMLTRLYSHKYKIPLKKLKERMAMVAVKNHKNGFLNELAQFRKEITVDTVLNSFMVCDPLQLFDCCPFSDGAAAIVLAPMDIARKYVDNPVRIAGVGMGSNGALITQKDFTIMKARQEASKAAYEMAGITPQDVDVVELHDCFTMAEIVALEMLGFYKPGEASEAVEQGETSLDGSLPVNPSGGLKSKGHPIGATGVAQAYEIVNQLRGNCGARQVKNAKIGLTDTLGGDICTVVNTVFTID